MTNVPTRLALLLVLFAGGWAGRELAVDRHPWLGSAFGAWSDHVSHRGAAELFTRFGFRIHDESPRALLGPPVGKRPSNVGVEEFRLADGTTAYVNWIDLPRPYSPLTWLLFAPATLAQRAGVDPVRLNLATVFVTFAVALLCGFFWARTLLTDALRRGRTTFALVVPFAAGGAFLLAKWGSAGFYDPIAVLCTMASVRALRERRWSASLAWWTLALGIHGRSLWLLGVPVAAAVAFLEERRWRHPHDLGLVAFCAVVAVPTLYAMGLASRHLALFPSQNLLSGAPTETLALFAAACSALAFVTAKRRMTSYWQLITLLAPLAIISTTRQVMPWHALSLLPLAHVAGIGEARRPLLATLAAGALVTWLMS